MPKVRRAVSSRKSSAKLPFTATFADELRRVADAVAAQGTPWTTAAANRVRAIAARLDAGVTLADMAAEGSMGAALALEWEAEQIKLAAVG